MSLMNQNEEKRDSPNCIKPSLTPMMAQWSACKEKAGEALLFFRMGDFYECFHEDAEVAALALDVTLTKRQGISMCGVPHMTVEGYIDKLVSLGFRVAVAEQTENPKEAKGLVKREIARIVTAGTVMNSRLLSDKAHNYIVSINRVGKRFGLAFLDLTTSHFMAAEFASMEELKNELYRLSPSEIVLSKAMTAKMAEDIAEWRRQLKAMTTTLDDWRFKHEAAVASLQQQLGTHTLEGFGLKGMVAAINAAGALIDYLKRDLSLPLPYVTEIHVFSHTCFLQLDKNTQRNLELTESLMGNRAHSLLAVIDRTQTAMGGRLLRQWLLRPLLDTEVIAKRQEGVEELLKAPLPLAAIGDLERLMIRIAAGTATPRDLLGLKQALAPLPALFSSLYGYKAQVLQECMIEPPKDIYALIDHRLTDEPPLRVSLGNVIRDGINQELDELRAILKDSKSWLAKYQSKLRESLGIKTVKVGYTKAFGYYIEVSRAQAENMPANFVRRQTLVNAQRYISDELKEYEHKVLGAEDRINAIESELFDVLLLEVTAAKERVLSAAAAVAVLDALSSFAKCAHALEWRRPLVDQTDALEIWGGRHPVIEALCSGEPFTANDTILDQRERCMILTGPNMAGKSTYIRQVALIVLLAQIGSFVPATSSHIGVCDKIFTRIGASDDLSSGQSTFMIEMTETANILHNATDRSLVILDEIGRGTSTYDGISIAWSVAEYLLTTAGKNAKTLFATHYFELTKMEEAVPGAVNYNVAVHESSCQIVFLRKIVRGDSDKSYGIHVGRLAGLPHEVLLRAEEILSHLEKRAGGKDLFTPPTAKRGKSAPKPGRYQLQLFER